MKHGEDEFLDDQVMPDFEKWQEKERQLKSQQQQQVAEPSMWRLVALVNGEKVEMEKVKAYSEKQAIYKLCFDLEVVDKNGNHPIKEGWKKAYATLKRFIKTHKKENLWVVNKSEEENTMDENKKNNAMNNNKEEMEMDEKKNIEAIVEKANKAAKETVAQKAVAEQSISETRKQYEAELSAKDAMVAVDVVGKATVQGNSFTLRILKDEKKPHGYFIVDEVGTEIGYFAWGKALVPNITIFRNDKFGIDFMKLSPYQKGENLVVDPDYVAIAVIIFGSEEKFTAQLRAEQNRRVDEAEAAAQRKQNREELFVKRNAEQMEAMAQREQERQAKLAAAKEAWKASELVDFTSTYGGKEVSLVARYLKSVDDKGNDIVKAVFAHRGTQKAFARLSWNTFYGGPMLTVTMKDNVWAYVRDEKGQPIIDEETNKPQVKWSKVEKRHELYMAKNGAIVKRGAYNKEVQATETEKATYTCICNGLATALDLPQPGPKAARYPMSDEEFFAGIENTHSTPLRRI